MASPTKTAPRVAIVGAGPGGLVLARLLHLANIPFVLYEAETSRTSREQGGSLDLHEKSGQLALHAAGLYSQWRKIARSEDDAMRIADKHGKLFIEEADELDHNRPEVDRVQLRALLLDSLPEGALQWGHKVRSISPSSEGDGKHEVRLETASCTRAEVFDLVIGADGAWSKVRPLLSDVKPHYSTVSCLDTRIRSVDTLHPAVSKLVGRGTYCALSDTKGLIAQRNGDGSIRTYICLLKPETWLQDVRVDWSDPVAAKKFLLEDEYRDWADELKGLIVHADPDIVPRPFYMHPPDFSWISKRGLTLLGDAAHLMTPFAGEGVNLALHDALDLSKAIVEASRNEGGSEVLFDAVKRYEKIMLERCHESMGETWRNLQLFFAPTAPRELAQMFREMMAGHGPPPEVVGHS
ncbi:putative monooxygenase [Usnea florida]